MAIEVLSEEQARAWLALRCQQLGGVGKLAKRAGVSKAFVSQLLHGKPISGRIATFLGLKKVNAYELTRVIPGPEQERYENERRNWREQNADFFSRYSKDAIELAAEARQALEQEQQLEVARISSGLSQTPAK